MKVQAFTRWLTALAAAACTLVEPAFADPPQSDAEVDRKPAAEKTLSLDAAIAAALDYSPELASSRAELQAADARAVQTGLWPNPTFEVELENVGGSGSREKVDQSETTVSLAQPFELGGKRAERRRVAAFGHRRLDYQLEARRQAIVAEVRKRFVKALLTQEHRALATEITRVSSEAMRTVEGRIRAGAATVSERGQVRILVSRARMDLDLAEREIIAARRQLAVMWGESEPSFAAVGNLEDVAPPPPLDELLARLDHNPEITRWDAEVDRRAAAIALERANRFPDVTIAAGARHFNDADDFAAVVGFSVPLPLFDRNQGGIAEAETLLTKARSDRETARLRARTELLAAYDELQMQFARISTLGVQVLADARTASHDIVAAYRRGAANAIDVLAAQRVFIDLQQEYFQALGDYHAALVDVQRLTTVSPDTEAVQ